jgi:outer membrane lipoprotein-sorting protein
MRKYLWAAATAALAVLVYAQTGPGQLLANYAKALNEAKSLKTTYTVQSLDGAPVAYSLELAKPNMAKIETPAEIITADGTTIVHYDKAQKTYSKDPQTDAALSSILGADAFDLWKTFFNPNALSKATAKSLGTLNVKGVPMNAVEASLMDGKKKVVFYLATTDGLAHKGEISYSDQASNEKLLVQTKTLEIGGAATPDQFAFNAPQGSRELTEEERLSADWYDDIEKAKEVAAKTKRLIFIDFYAEW